MLVETTGLDVFIAC